MSILLFLIILSVLIFVHEFGHFLVAKWNGIRIDSFALGFPPTLWSKKIGETTYKLNLLPFGGYVSIHGENYEHQEKDDPDRSRSFVAKKWWQQISVLIAGIMSNWILALFLMILVAWIGAPVVQEHTFLPNGIPDPDIQTMVLDVVQGSPAQQAGITVGDRLASYQTSQEEHATRDVMIEDFITIIRETTGTLELHLERGQDNKHIIIDIQPQLSVVDGESISSLGMALGYVKYEQRGFLDGIAFGFTRTVDLTTATAQGLWDLVRGKGDVSQISGPVGIADMVGNASRQGFSLVLIFSAILSLNLALLNLIPFPALDGGRILFVLIETIIRKPIPAKVAMWVNACGFGILILLMLVVTVKDIVHLVK